MYNPNWFRPYIDYWGNEAPSQFAYAFAQTVPITPGETRLLDIGCGSGILGLYCLMEKKARSATFIDIEPYWVSTTQQNVSARIRDGKISESQVRFLQPAAFREIPIAEVAQHDLVVFNAPQLPGAYIDEETRRKIDSDPIEQRFRRGGESGLDVVEQFFAWYAGLPTPKPDAVVLLSSFLGRKRIDEAISASGLRSCEPPAETDATLRPMFWKQAEAFSQSPAAMEDRSLSKIDGTWHKRLLTFRLANK